MQEKLELPYGKLDWKGRQATKYKHGGTRASVLTLGMYLGFVNCDFYYLIGFKDK